MIKALNTSASLRHFSRQLAKTLLGFSGVFALLAVWQLWISAAGINAIVAPSPLSVALELVGHPRTYLENTAVTLMLAAGGLLCGMLLGFILALASWTSRIIGGLLLPASLLFSSVPVIALIPIITHIVGYDGRSVLAVVILISFFPAYIFLSAGLRATPNGSGDVFAALGASKLSQLIWLAFPSALPNAMVALRLAAAQAILAAIVAEFLIGTSGLGYLFHAAKDELNMERAFAASLIATVISTTSFLAASSLERKVRVWWQ